MSAGAGYPGGFTIVSDGEDGALYIDHEDAKRLRDRYAQDIGLEQFLANNGAFSKLTPAQIEAIWERT